LDGVDDKIFDDEHRKINLAQNHDKAVRQISIRGPGSAGVARAVANANGVVGKKVFSVEARYLGPYLHNDNTYNRELDRRIKHLHIVFRMWNKFWMAEGIPIKTKIMLFKGIVIQILFSAVIAFVLSKSNYVKIESVVCRKVRAMLKGRACVRGAGGEIVGKLTNVNVLAVIGLGPMHIDCGAQTRVVS
jgi:hypothetical protein